MGVAVSHPFWINNSRSENSQEPRLVGQLNTSLVLERLACSYALGYCDLITILGIKINDRFGIREFIMVLTHFQTGRNHGTHLRMEELSLLTCLSRALALTALQSPVPSLQHPTAQPSADWNGLDQLKTFSSVQQCMSHRWRLNTVIHVNTPWDTYSPGPWDTSGKEKEHGTHKYKLLQTSEILLRTFQLLLLALLCTFQFPVIDSK